MDQRDLINRLDFRHIALLVALDETRNLHCAELKLNIESASATCMLSDIEEIFGCLLFERNECGLQPTLLGSATLDYARRSLIELTRVAASLEVKNFGGFGQVTVGATTGAGLNVLALAIAELKTERPLLGIKIIETTSHQLMEQLRSGEVDFALGYMPLELDQSDLDSEPLASERILLVAGEKHPMLREKELKLDVLMRWPWVLQPLTSPVRLLFEAELADAGLTLPMNSVECGSIFETIRIVQKGEAIALLPESIVRDYLKSGRLVSLPFQSSRTLPGFGLLRRKAESLSEPVAFFIALLCKYSASA